MSSLLSKETLASLDIRTGAFVAFASVAVVTGVRWVKLALEQRRLRSRLETKPSIDKSVLINVLNDLEGPAQSIAAEAGARSSVAGPLDGDAKAAFADLHGTLAQELTNEEHAVFKRHGVTCVEVEDCYKYYSNLGHMDVIEAAAPIKKAAGKFLLDKDTCRRLVQSAVEHQCESAGNVVSEVCSDEPVTPQNAQIVFNTVMQQLFRIGDIKTEEEYGVTMVQILEYAQAMGSDDPEFWSEINQMSSMSQHVVQQHLGALLGM